MRRTESLLARVRESTKTMGGPPLALTREEAAKALGISERALKDLIHAGVIITCFLDGESLVPASEIRRHSR